MIHCPEGGWVLGPWVCLLPGSIRDYEEKEGKLAPGEKFLARTRLSRSYLFFPGKTLALKMPNENTREDLSYEMANVKRGKQRLAGHRDCDTN